MKSYNFKKVIIKIYSNKIFISLLLIFLKEKLIKPLTTNYNLLFSISFLDFKL